MKILVADDDPILRQLLSAQLSRNGREVVQAADGEIAWDLMRQESIRLLITDWVMPGLDGPALIHRIRETVWPGYIYILLLSAKDGKDHVVNGLLAGSDDYVTKPFHPGELEARVTIGERILALESRLSQSMAQLEHLATRDALTGLFNRRAFDERLTEEIRRAKRYERPLALVMADIDYLKIYNDRYGHAQGDYLLREVAQVLAGNVRSTDFVARYGGDEFAIILPETDRASAQAVVEKIRSRIDENAFQLGASQPGGAVRVSLGVAGCPEDLADSGNLLAMADKELYRDKDSRGPGQWLFVTGY